MILNRSSKPSPARSNLKYFLAGVTGLGLLGGVSFVFTRQPELTARIQQQLATTSASFNSPESALKELLPEPPFSDLTIPHLRQRTYQSQLNPLEKISDRSTYTTYLTSYDSDGNRINALITQPTGTPPEDGWPAIVFVHGYIQPTLYRTQEKYVEYVDYLARNGFVVFKIDLRGHGDSEGSPSGSYYSSGYVIDTLNAIAALETSSFVNPQKIGLWGHSMAGNVVMRSLAAKPTIPAVAIWGGAGFSYVDLRQYGLQDNSYRPPSNNASSSSERQRLFATHGQFDPENNFWKQVVPTNYLDDVTGAIQLHHAKDDVVVSAKYSQDLNDILDKTSIPHETYFYPTGGHNITGSSFSQAMQRTVEFYSKYLGK